MPIMDIFDAEPSVKELSSAIDALVAGKAPGSDGIPAEILKCAKHSLLDHLHQLLCLCFARVILKRLQTLADKVYPESQIMQI